LGITEIEILTAMERSILHALIEADGKSQIAAAHPAASSGACKAPPLICRDLS